MREIWKESIIKGYEISNLGRVKNIKTNHIMKLEKEEKGYCRFSLKMSGTKKHYAVHRLVALAFIPNPLNKPQVDHKDNDKSNNSVDNLQWVTNEENNKLRWERKAKYE